MKRRSLFGRREYYAELGPCWESGSKKQTDLGLGLQAVLIMAVITDMLSSRPAVKSLAGEG